MQHKISNIVPYRQILKVSGVPRIKLKYQPNILHRWSFFLVFCFLIAVSVSLDSNCTGTAAAPVRFRKMSVKDREEQTIGAVQSVSRRHGCRYNPE